MNGASEPPQIGAECAMENAWQPAPAPAPAPAAAASTPCAHPAAAAEAEPAPAPTAGASTPCAHPAAWQLHGNSMAIAWQ